MIARLSLCGMLLSLITLASGCGSSERTVPVSGKALLYGKQPLPTWYAVNFVPDAAKGNNSKLSPFGKVKEDGIYSLVAPPGAYKVVLISTEASVPADKAVAIHASYFAPEQTPLSVEVVETPTTGAYDLSVDPSAAEKSAPPVPVSTPAPTPATVPTPVTVPPPSSTPTPSNKVESPTMKTPEPHMPIRYRPAAPADDGTTNAVVWVCWATAGLLIALSLSGAAVLTVYALHAAVARGKARPSLAAESATPAERWELLAREFLGKVSTYLLIGLLIFGMIGGVALLAVGELVRKL